MLLVPSETTWLPISGKLFRNLFYMAGVRFRAPPELNMAYSRDEIIQKIRDAATAAGINADVAVSQAQAESNFNPNARSGAGAQGLFQFMPGTWAVYGQGGNPFDVDDAVPAYIAYMKKLLSQFGGRYDLALAGYNWGENRNVLRSWFQMGTAIDFTKIPGETANYVKKILNLAGRPDFMRPAKVTPPAPAIQKPAPKR